MFGILDPVDLQISVPMYVAMGEAFSCAIDIMPKVPITIKKVEVELFCIETAVTRGETDLSDSRKVFGDVKVPGRDVKVKRDQGTQYKGAFILPPMSPPTISAPNHSVDWWVTAKIEIPFMPEIRKEVPVVVLPCFLIFDQQ
jgi:hypothetical protein